MKNLLHKFLVACVFVFSAGPGTASGQQAKINPLAVKPSHLIEEIRNFKASNPGASAEETAKAANSLLDKFGFNYVFALTPGNCQKIEQIKKTQKDPAAPINIRAKLNSVAGDAAVITLPDTKTDSAECGRCFIHLPVWEANEKEFVTFIQNINVKFLLPPDLILNEMALVDGANLNAVVRRWKVPYRARPLSVSDDGKILYLPLPEGDLKDLALMIYDEGVLQFCARKDIVPEKKGFLLKEFPADAGNPNLSFIEFKSGGQRWIVRFTAGCTC